MDYPGRRTRRCFPNARPCHDRHVLCDSNSTSFFPSTILASPSPPPLNRALRHVQVGHLSFLLAVREGVPASHHHLSAAPNLPSGQMRSFITSSEASNFTRSHARFTDCRCRRLALLTWEHDLRRSNEGRY